MHTYWGVCGTIFVILAFPLTAPYYRAYKNKYLKSLVHYFTSLYQFAWMQTSPLKQMVGFCKFEVYMKTTFFKVHWISHVYVWVSGDADSEQQEI